MTDADYTHIALVIDRSGSMQSIKTDTEGAVNQFIKDQQAIGGHATLTLVTFHTEVTLVHDKIALADAPDFELHPAGMTALFDAVGATIQSTGDWLSSLEEDARPGKVVFVIMTDGLENSSREYTQEAVAAATKLQTETYGWEFTYLGANQDAVLVAKGLGIARDFAVTYSGEYVTNAVGAASAAVTRSRLGGDRAYTEAERSAAVGDQMPRPEGVLPPGLEFTDAESHRYWTDPLFHARVYTVARTLTSVYGTEANEALAFGIQAVKNMETLDRPAEPISGY